MNTIFIVDDEETNRIAVKRALNSEYKTYAMESAAMMFKLLEKLVPDLILLDVDMPEMDGFKAMAQLKAEERYQSIPVVFLTAMHDEAFEIQGLELGALDFLHKPFTPSVLIKRVETYLNNAKLIKQGTGILSFGGLKLDNTALRAFLNGTDLDLSVKEYSLLILFAQNQGTVFSAEDLYEKVWLRPLCGNKQAVKTAVSRLRNKLAGSGFSIKFINGKGYCFKED